MNSRVERAVTMFEEGYNCAQSVFVTYADVFGMNREDALKLASPMGAGMGRMREVCGVVSSMALLAGMKQGNTDPGNDKGKEEIYQLVQEMFNTFQKEKGSIICRELLGYDNSSKAEMESPMPQRRTKQYYATRPCSALIAEAAKIIEEKLLSDIW